MINASGTLEGIEAEERSFSNATEMVRLVGKSLELTECMARSFVRFATQREEVEGETTHILSSLPEDDRSLRALIVSVAASRGFTHHAPSAQEKP